MEIRKRMTPAVGGAVAAAAALLMAWVGSNPQVADALGRYGVNFRSTEDSGVPGLEAVGFQREVLGESYGAGRPGLTRRGFLARSGQVLVLDYEVAVSRGFLRLSVDRGALLREELWGQPLHEDHRQTLRLPIPTTGVYRVTVSQYGHAGTYHVRWRLENP